MRRMCTSAANGLVAVLLLVSQAADAMDFRIATQVFVDGGDEPISENLTLFHDGSVYDFQLTSPQEAVVFDPKREEFVLLDPTERRKVKLSKEEILAFVRELRAKQQGKDRFFFNPKFDESYNESAGRLTLSSDRVTYRVDALTAPDIVAVRQYKQFADWYAQLNATSPGRMPPFPRMELNKALAERWLIPQHIDLTVSVPGGSPARKIKVRSEHRIEWKLSNADLQRIQQVQQDTANFRAVGLIEYRRPAEATSVGRNRDQ